MIDGIRESRRKFNELIRIYEARIGKLEEKVRRVMESKNGGTVQNSAKSNRK